MVGPLLTRDGRDNRLDEFRLILALMVLGAHSYFASEGHHSSDPLARVCLNQITSGSLAVDGFFAISGFLVTESWSRSRGLGDFLCRRVLRIYPGFVVACLLIASIAGPLGAVSFDHYWAEFEPSGFLKSVVLLQQPMLPQTFQANPARNIIAGSLWTISFEFGCYLVVAGLGFTRLLRGPVVAILLAVTELAAVVRLGSVPLVLPRRRGGISVSRLDSTVATIREGFGIDPDHRHSDRALSGGVASDFRCLSAVLHGIPAGDSRATQGTTRPFLRGLSLLVSDPATHRGEAAGDRTMDAHAPGHSSDPDHGLFQLVRGRTADHGLEGSEWEPMSEEAEVRVQRTPVVLTVDEPTVGEPEGRVRSLGSSTLEKKS